MPVQKRIQTDDCLEQQPWERTQAGVLVVREAGEKGKKEKRDEERTSKLMLDLGVFVSEKGATKKNAGKSNQKTANRV